MLIPSISISEHTVHIPTQFGAVWLPHFPDINLNSHVMLADF